MNHHHHILLNSVVLAVVALLALYNRFVVWRVGKAFSQQQIEDCRTIRYLEKRVGRLENAIGRELPPIPDGYDDDCYPDSRN